MWEYILTKFTFPFYLKSLQFFFQRSPCSFLISFSSFIFCVKFPTREETFGTLGCLSFYSLADLCVWHLRTFSGFPWSMQNPKKGLFLSKMVSKNNIKCSCKHLPVGQHLKSSGENSDSFFRPTLISDLANLMSLFFFNAKLY